MALGACFWSYEDFREWFRALKLAQGCRYGLRSGVSVCCHNRQRGAFVREDVMFMQVTFGCSRLQKYKKRKRKLPSLFDVAVSGGHRPACDRRTEQQPHPCQVAAFLDQSPRGDGQPHNRAVSAAAGSAARKQCCGRDLENLNQAFSSTVDGWSSFREKPSTHTSAAAEPDPVSACPSLAEPARQAAEAGPGCMLTVLQESCTDLGYWLCLKEWEVVQASTQLLSPTPGNLTGSLRVQLLEGAHQVSPNCRSCSCCFHRRYRLPCRHILAVLRARRGRVEEGMVCRRWHRRYWQLPVSGTGPQGCSGGLAGSRRVRVWSLSLELATLLLQSEGEELERRRAALAAVLAAWARSPVRGEAAGKEPLPVHCSG